MQLRDKLGLEPVVVKNFPRAVPLANKDPSLIYGVELEIENVPGYIDMVVPGIDQTQDGSLRNYGREFITKPMTYSNLAYCLTNFFTKNKFGPTNYSERCSIHVHTNVQDMVWDQVQTLTLLYQVVERLLFRWIGDDRENNIFCVPLHQTIITYSSIGAGPDPQNFRHWEKYTALNFLPMFTQGTVEWRHMAGHSDVARILMWCNIIGALFAWAKQTPFEEAKTFITELNTSSAYEMFMNNVFGELSEQFMKEPDFRQLLEDGVLDVKYSIYHKKNIKILKDRPKAVRIDDLFHAGDWRPTPRPIVRPFAEAPLEVAFVNAPENF